CMSSAEAITAALAAPSCFERAPSDPTRQHPGGGGPPGYVDDRKAQAEVERWSIRPLRLQKWVDMDKTILADLPFDPAEHLYWRLHESAGKVFWETSADGQTFTTKAMAEAPFPVTAFDLTLGFFNYGAAPTAFEA